MGKTKTKKVNHVSKKDGTTFCGKKQQKDAPFDAPACKECSAIVRESFG